jgi:hypothetical protein
MAVFKTLAEAQKAYDEAQARLVVALQPRAITYKVSEKGGLSAYGINSKFPVTLYVEQWERLDADEERAKRLAFIAANTKTLSRKAAA